MHGDEQNTTDFAENLKLEGYETYAPKIGEAIKLE
jgi:predicted metal-dependent RNase